MFRAGSFWRETVHVRAWSWGNFPTTRIIGIGQRAIGKWWIWSEYRGRRSRWKHKLISNFIIYCEWFFSKLRLFIIYSLGSYYVVKNITRAEYQKISDVYYKLITIRSNSILFISFVKSYCHYCKYWHKFQTYRSIKKYFKLWYEWIQLYKLVNEIYKYLWGNPDQLLKRDIWIFSSVIPIENDGNI